MKKISIKKIVLFLLVSVIYAIIGVLIALIIAKRTGNRLQDCLTIEGLLVVILGVFTRMKGKLPEAIINYEPQKTPHYKSFLNNSIVQLSFSGLTIITGGILIFASSIFLTSYSNLGSPNNETKTDVVNTGRAYIDWVDFIMLNDVQYIRNYLEDNKLAKKDIGDVIGEVHLNTSENIHDLRYKTKNGDAAYLPKGTAIYKLKGYKADFRIAVNIDREWRIYEADTNPGAKKGADLLDIGTKVSYIGINSETDGTTELGAVKDSAAIERLVKLVLDAEVNQNSQDHDGERYFISFHLLDGSTATRCYWINSGELTRGILLPEEFGLEIRKALAK